MIPIITITVNQHSNSGFTAFDNIINDGRERAVTLIIKESIVPMPTPFANNASAMGIVPNISAYIGTPTALATITEYHLSSPRTDCIHSAGMKLWIAAPVPTPTRIYIHTFFSVNLV